jgi:diguanylate cyclase (GGDEF)-like protein
MIAHTPTLFGSVALVAIIMAGCLLLTGQFNRRDGLITGGLGLLAHALAYVCYTLYGYTSPSLTYLLGNTLLSTAMMFYTASIYRIAELPVPWLKLVSAPAAMLIGVGVLFAGVEPRKLLACLILVCQCLLVLHLAHRYGRLGGRAHLLLIIGSLVSLVALALRIIAILGGDAETMRYDSNGLAQTVSVAIGTLTVMMISLGIVLLAKERTDATLKALALQDGLTGILNRRAIMERLCEEIERARRTERPLAIVMLDIDHFKTINDQYGHLAGDEVLCRCVSQLCSRLRQTDLIGRYGGEEFMILLPDTAAAGAHALIESLRNAVETAPVAFDAKLITVSFSAGIWCGVPGPEQTTDQLVGAADSALYASKAAGRNTLRFAAIGDIAVF